MRKKQSPRTEQQNKRVLEQINHNAAGADMGSDAVWICVGEHMADEPVRVFGTTTAQLRASAEWMRSVGVDTIALEATGVYWVAAYEIYEEYGLRPILISSRAIRSFNGMKKSDFIDCQWIQLLHTFGILQASARPEAAIIELRGYMRQRRTITEQCSEQIQRMQKALTLMNVRLDQAVTDITGMTGMRILRAILDEGQRDPAKLAALRDRGCAKSEREIAEALTGHWREEQLFVLGQTVKLWDFCQKLLRECDEKIEALIRKLPVRASAEGKPSTAKRRKNQVSFDGRTLLEERLGVDLTRIKGLDVLTILTVISESGKDLSRFPTDNHYVSWLGLAPGTKKSGHRVLSTRSRRTTNRASTALRLAAQSLLKSQSELGAFGRALRARIGAEKAITAVAAKLARRIYHSLLTGRVYEDRGAAYHDQQHHEHNLASLHKRARRFGMQLIPLPAA